MDLAQRVDHVRWRLLYDNLVQMAAARQPRNGSTECERDASAGCSFEQVEV